MAPPLASPGRPTSPHDRTESLNHAVLPCEHAGRGSCKKLPKSKILRRQVLNVGESGVKWSSKRTVIAELEQKGSNHTGGSAKCFWVLTLHVWTKSPD